MAYSHFSGDLLLAIKQVYEYGFQKLIIMVAHESPEVLFHLAHIIIIVIIAFINKFTKESIRTTNPPPRSLRLQRTLPPIPD